MTPIPRRAPTYVFALASLAVYRRATIGLLLEHFGRDLAVFSGAPAYDTSIRLMSPADDRHRQVRNRFAPGHVLLQWLPWRLLLRSPVLLLDLNPRVPHVWLLLLARRATRRPTILWGHAWPRRGPDSGTERLRRSLRSLADVLVTYTESQAVELRRRHPATPVFCAPNALYSSHDYAFDAGSIRHSVVYVGRLHPDKKPLLLLDAFEILASQLLEPRLEIVGDGPELDAVRERVTASPAADRIRVHGHIDDPAALRTIYGRSFASVSPGYAGLSITQSLGFGVPMVIALDEPHAPEIEAARDGWNALFFTSDSAPELADTLARLLSERDLLASGDDIVADCALRYSVEAMAEGLIRALESVRPR